MYATQINDFIQVLRQIEAEVPKMDRQHSRLLDELREGSKEAMRELEQMVLDRNELRDALEALELAQKNGAATFARFDQKAAKDANTLSEAKKRLSAPAFDDSAPILVAQRLAFTRAAQKLDFLIVEMDKLRGALANKYAKGTSAGFKELAGLCKALEADEDRFQDPSFIKSMHKKLEYLAQSHHLVPDR